MHTSHICIQVFLICFSFLFCRINKENISQGNIGIAVIKSTTDETLLRIILYRTKQNVLSTLNLNKSCNSKVFIKQGYVQYQDDDQQFWSIRFDVDNDRTELLAAINKHCLIEYDVIEEKTIDIPNVIVPSTVEKPIQITGVDTTTKIDCSTTVAEQTKRSLVTRMAKMGKQLPQVVRSPASTKDSSSPDESDTDVCKERYKPALPKWKPEVPTRIPHEMIPYSGITAAGPPMLATSTLISYNQNMMAEHGVNAFLSENRIQNTEVRMNLSKLETKIEKVLDKIDSINLRTDSMKKTDIEEELLQMEEKMLALKRENRQLRIKIEELNTGDTANNANNKDLTAALDIATTTNKRLQTELNNQSTELQRLTKSANAKNEEIERLRTHTENIAEDHKKIIDQKQAELNMALDEYNCKQLENETKIKQLEFMVSQLDTEKYNNLKALEVNEEKIKLLKMQLEEMSKKEQPSLDITIKEIMNYFYQTFQDQLDETSTYNSEEILKIVRVLIKKETTAALNRNAINK